MARLFKKLKRSMSYHVRTEHEKQTGKVDWLFRLSEMYHDTSDYIYYKLRQPVEIFFESCIRTYKWLPIIWKDRHWDYGFILEILKHKLRFTREYIDKYGHFRNNEIVVKQLRVAEFLIQRLQDDNYCEFEQKEHDKKWGELDWSRKGRNNDNILFDNKFSCSGLTRPGIKSQKDWEQEMKEQKRITFHRVYLQKQDKEYLFKHICKHLQAWWN